MSVTLSVVVVVQIVLSSSFYYLYFNFHSTNVTSFCRHAIWTVEVTAIHLFSRLLSVDGVNFHWNQYLFEISLNWMLLAQLKLHRHCLAVSAVISKCTAEFGGSHIPNLAWKSFPWPVASYIADRAWHFQLGQTKSRLGYLFSYALH